MTIMNTIFTVENEHLARLSPQEAVEFFREVLWAEARSIGVPIGSIHVSSWINVPDGGIDALIEEGSIPTRGDLIKERCTSYQIKAGAAFEPGQDAEIRKELFGDKDPGKANLGSSVRDCLDNNGTYVLVCFKKDLTVEQRRQAIETLESYFKLCGYEDPSVEVWSQNNLIGFLEAIPSLALRANGRRDLRFQTWQSWSQDAEMKRGFVVGEKQKKVIADVKNELLKNDAAVHIRIYGEPGIGKTRLALEATSADDLRPLVLYCDAASKFRDSELMNEILREDNPFSVVLVIDECDQENRSYIWNKLKNLGPRIKLVSIYNEYDDTVGSIGYFDTPSLDIQHVSDIVQGYGVAKEKADRWAGICDGSPRVAHVIGSNLILNPDDLLKEPDTVTVWQRYIVGGDAPGCEQVRQRRLVLEHIALFKRFGYGPPVVAEARAIARLVEEVDPQITWARFQAIISQLRRRKILQGENTLYITPKALHIRLWIDWWEVYGSTFNFETFSGRLTPKLLEWFYDMFRYGAESVTASRIVKELLGDRGPFRNGGFLDTKVGASLFLALTEADPTSALERLKRTIGTWSKQELLKFATGRRDVVWALEKIAVRRDLFPDAARMLLALGEAESETWSNNASGVFAALFSTGRGRVAPTEASPQERFPILKEAMDSSSRERRVLALQACNVALESQHFVRTIGAEHQGLRKEPNLWTPKTYGEWFHAYREVWQLLVDSLDKMPEEEQQQAVSILLQHARGLGAIANLSDMVIGTVNELANKAYVMKKDVLSMVLQTLHYERGSLPSSTRQRWEQLRDNLTGSSFSSLMRRYVGMVLLEDRFDEHGNHVDQTQPRMEELAHQAVEDIELLRPELDWLMTTEAQNGYRYGYELGKIDKDFSLLSMLLEAQRRTAENASAYFLSGYFRAVFENDQEKWERLLDDLTKDKKLIWWVPELTCQSGMSDQGALRVLDLAKTGAIGIPQFGMLGFGGNIRDLREDVLRKWIEFLLDSADTSAISIALHWYYSYYQSEDSRHALPEELTLQLLTHASLFQQSQFGKRPQMNDYLWTVIANAFLHLYPERGLELADKMLEHFGEDGTIMDGFRSEPEAVLDEVTRRYPEEVWVRVTKYVGPPMDSRAFHIVNWLRGERSFGGAAEGPLPMIPLEKVWGWVDKDVEKRAHYLASFVPNALFKEEGKTCLAREVLIRYGTRQDVRDSLIANFSTEGWMGPQSLHFERKKQQLLDVKQDEENANVRLWIDEYVSLLDGEIYSARVEEERDDF